MSVQAILQQEYAALLSHPVVRSVDLLRYAVNRLDGYLRARCVLSNDDFLEVALHVSSTGVTATVDDYRYQWMNPGQTILRRRWDNTPHFPRLSGAPHHCHISDSSIEPSQPMNTTQLLDILADLIHSS